ncbi:hypothetical protein EON66_08065 [archaeon]|nr:MAG: hypothetical protein EON66_08065 [archaeon]
MVVRTGRSSRAASMRVYGTQGCHPACSTLTAMQAVCQAAVHPRSGAAHGAQCGLLRVTYGCFRIGSSAVAAAHRTIAPQHAYRTSNNSCRSCSSGSYPNLFSS